MARRADDLVQIATRIPKSLQRRAKFYCLTHGLTMIDFIVEAVQAHLATTRAREPRRAVNR